MTSLKTDNPGLIKASFLDQVERNISSPKQINGTFLMKKRRSSRSIKATDIASPKGRKLVNHSKSFRIDKKKFVNRTDNVAETLHQKTIQNQEKIISSKVEQGGQQNLSPNSL